MMKNSAIRTHMLAVAAALPLLMYAWGQKGHDVTAYIAEQHLTPATLAAVDSLLDGYSIVYYANWLDNASHTPQYAYSKTWHYKNIDEKETFDSMPLNKDGDIVTALEAQTKVLADPKASKEEKALALKMVVHLMGDVHQPMHLGRKSDLGGNTVKIKYFGKDNKLHTIWDSYLVESAHKWGYTDWARELDRPALVERVEVEGTPDTWARETYEIAKQVYDATPDWYEVSFNYVADWSPVIEQQLLRGGLRLAYVLNGIFDPAGATEENAQ